jgi:hypothetical protein
MSELLIRCPVWGLPSSTGLDLDNETLNRLPDVESRFLCSHCGKEHVWRPNEAWLADGDAPPPLLRAG